MILVTGGTGLVGAHLLLELTQHHTEIRAIHRKGSDLERVRRIFGYYLSATEAKRCFSSIQWVEASLNDIPALEEAFIDIERVYHCAARVSFDPRNNHELRKANIEGTANIVNLCISHQVEKLCYTSSVATLDPNLGEDFITETSLWKPELPHNQYAISKYGAEMEVWRGSQEGVPVVIVNPGVIIGPGIWDTGSGVMFLQIFNGLRYSFPKVTGFVGVNDVVKVMTQLMESDIVNKKYVVVAENRSFMDVLNLTAASLGKPAPSRNLKPWMVYLGWVYQRSIGRWTSKEHRLSKNSHQTLFAASLYSSKKLQQELGFQFEPLDEVIVRTADLFLKEHLDKQRCKKVSS